MMSSAKAITALAAGVSTDRTGRLDRGDLRVGRFLRPAGPALLMEHLVGRFRQIADPQYRHLPQDRIEFRGLVEAGGELAEAVEHRLRRVGDHLHDVDRRPRQRRRHGPRQLGRVAAQGCGPSQNLRASCRNASAPPGGGKYWRCRPGRTTRSITGRMLPAGDGAVQGQRWSRQAADQDAGDAQLVGEQQIGRHHRNPGSKPDQGDMPAHPAGPHRLGQRARPAGPAIPTPRPLADPGPCPILGLDL